MIRFLLNEQLIEVSNQRADLTLLEYLREQQHLCGSKEGCASGDCGACTISLVQPNSNKTRLEYTAINSCVTYLSGVHNKQVITVEHLAEGDKLHPVQQAMVDQHASQCGFCTPGFVMSLFSFYHQDRLADLNNIELALSGNLCRCTGYRPIIDAAKQACETKQLDKFDLQAQKTLTTLSAMRNKPMTAEHLYLPTDRQQLAALLAHNANAVMFSGSTDLALETTQKLTDHPCLISLKQVKELNQLNQTDHSLYIGAALAFGEIEAALLTAFPELSELLWRFASVPIRNQASLGGNIANASPIGDMPPVLLALEGTIHLDNGKQRRDVAAGDFFIGYRQTVMAKGEWIEAITLPKINRTQTSLKAYKVSKRMEDDISAVCAVFKLEIDGNNQITKLTSGFGGVAATPVTAEKLPHTLLGKDWRLKATMQEGYEILLNQFTPIDDVRASASYRQKIVANLWQRFWYETANSQNQIATRTLSHA
ncbi:xanthine dehydrogenase small subunit [Aliiglaciecola sp. LCG003]|uniref:xanthine dehydrogenase small subunit n=1 Tax=Aliiglaciecola sp. LCG003 TaxID=3053655 RepID=UPI0025722F32|nr:xanthine dehydrogenase small subunit [Aliiglaciecola sp. LCG003]WJG11218.1 xanthine dehydrogenase small subunit [Aliiglaciecola sp. LCG003]